MLNAIYLYWFHNLMLLRGKIFCCKIFFFLVTIIFTSAILFSLPQHSFLLPQHFFISRTFFFTSATFFSLPQPFFSLPTFFYFLFFFLLLTFFYFQLSVLFECAANVRELVWLIFQYSDDGFIYFKINKFLKTIPSYDISLSILKRTLRINGKKGRP